MCQVTETQKVLIEHACTKQIIKFASLNDANAYDELVKLFTEQGEFARPSRPSDVVVGRAAILEAFQQRPLRKSVHVVSNIIVNVINSTEATASSLIVLYSAASGEIAELPVLIGGFEDRLTLTDGEWLFASRRGRIELKLDNKQP